MPKISKYQERFNRKRQSERAGVPFTEASPGKREKHVFSTQEAQQRFKNHDQIFLDEVHHLDTSDDRVIDKAPEGIERPKRVYFMSRNDASGYPFRPDDVVISITDTHDQPPQFFHQPKEVLHRAFHDHVTAYSEHHHGHRWCRLEDGEAIVEFVQKHKDAPNIIVHCNMGQSRSKAAAIAIGELTGRDVKFMHYRTGQLVAYRDDGDHGNHRVQASIHHAWLDWEDKQEKAAQG